MKQKLYPGVSIRFEKKLRSSSRKTRADYGGYEDRSKHGLVAAVLELFPRAPEGVPR
jgi:hypothetical protein